METKKIDIIINNIQYKVPDGLNIWQACELVNIHIPRFCFHEKLSVAGNCRMCLVEIDKAPKLAASCALPVSNGIRVYTNTPMVRKAREAVMEALLINHPLDCPICDQGGECDLQDQSLHYGTDRTRFHTYKRSVEDKECGPIIKTIMTRCIHCTRCVRFAAEIAGLPVLGTFGRGEKTEIGTYVKKFVQTELSGNLVDICPVGALTSKPYAFVARSWELKKLESVDYSDGTGSQILIHTRHNKNSSKNLTEDVSASEQILRILPKKNSYINDFWISDKTRYSFDGLKKNRLFEVIHNEAHTELSWKSIIKLYSSIFNQMDKFNMNLLFRIDNSLSFNDIFFISIFSKIWGSYNIKHNDLFLNYNFDDPNFYRFNSRIESIENTDFVFTVGCDLRYESSVINTRLREHIFRNSCSIDSIGFQTSPNMNINQRGVNLRELVKVAEGKSSICKHLRYSRNPLIIVGNSISKRLDYLTIKNILNFINKKTIISTKSYNGFNTLNTYLSGASLAEFGAIRSSQNPKFSLDSKEISSFTINVDTNETDKNASNNLLISSFSYFSNLNDFKTILPLTPLYEKNDILINTEGFIQTALKSTSAHSNCRKLENIFQGLLFESVKKTSLDKVNLDFFKKLFPNTVRSKRKIQKLNTNFFLFKENKTKVYFSNFSEIIRNFYMSDSLSKNSQTMSLASAANLSVLKTNFIKNFDEV